MNTLNTAKLRLFGAAALTASLTLSAASPSFGAIFRTVDAQGNVTYTDQPPRAGSRAKSEEITISTTNTFQDTTPYERWDPAAEESGETAGATYSLKIVSPGNEESIRNNAGNVVIQTQIAPELATGHVARLELDGSLTGDPVDSGSIQLANVPRGTHTARLVVENEKGKRIAVSPESVFHVQRISLLSPSRGRGPATAVGRPPAPPPPAPTPQPRNN